MFSILSEHVGFSVWVIWSVMVLFMPEPVWGFTVTDKFLLTTTPALLGSFVRLPYTFAIAKFGGRNWTVVSAALLLVPALLAVVLLEPGVSFGTLLLVTAVAGVGGGTFASSMANINNFYPQHLKGRALGLNAGGGNLGVALCRSSARWCCSPTALDRPAGDALPVHPAGPGGDGTGLDPDGQPQRGQERQGRDAGGRPAPAHGDHLLALPRHVRLVHRLRLRLRAGVAAAGAERPIYYVWLGAFAGSLIRPVGGILADRYRGSVVSFWTFLAMTAAAVVVAVAADSGAIPLLARAFTVLFMLTGLGNGSVYKMIPAIFHAESVGGASAGRSRSQDRRLASALVGIAGAVGAFGGVLVQVAFRESFLAYGDGSAAYLAFIGFYLACAVVTWAVYLRPSPRRLVGV